MSSLQEALWGGADRLDLDEGFFDIVLRCFVLSLFGFLRTSKAWDGVHGGWRSPMFNWDSYVF